jgi:NADH:ubiquinone oxidoreductase subunit D
MTIEESLRRLLAVSSQKHGENAFSTRQVNLSIPSKILPGHMISDVVTILGSLDFVMGECDR